MVEPRNPPVRIQEQRPFDPYVGDAHGPMAPPAPPLHPLSREEVTLIVEAAVAPVRAQIALLMERKP